LAGWDGDVCKVVPATRGCAAEGVRAEWLLLVAVEGNAVMLVLDDLLRRLASHDLDGVLVAEVVGALDGDESVRLPGVLGVERRVDAALRRVRVRADRVNLRQDPDRDALLGGRKRGALPGQAGTDHKDVMEGHSFSQVSLPGLRRRRLYVRTSLGVRRGPPPVLKRAA